MGSEHERRRRRERPLGLVLRGYVLWARIVAQLFWNKAREVGRGR